MGIKAYGSTLILFAACSAVGVLAALGKFNSMMNFPVVFAGICLFFGLVSLWRDRPRQAVAARVVLLLLGTSIAVGGWLYQKQVIERSLVRVQREVFASLGGKPAPLLGGLEPLNTEPDTLEAAAAFSGNATIIAFWATWCSPCWKEMTELEELYREHRYRGLTVLALTQYDHPADADGRRRDVEKAEKFLRKRDLTFPAAITAENDIYLAYQVRSIPSTALVDGNGDLVAYGVGLDGARVLMEKARALVSGD